jgi:hypothetical protein
MISLLESSSRIKRRHVVKHCLQITHKSWAARACYESFLFEKSPRIMNKCRRNNQFDWRIHLESGATGCCHTCLQSFGIFGNCLRINHSGVKVGALFFIPEIDSYTTRGTNSLYGSSLRFSWSTIIGQINSNWCQIFGTNVYLSCKHNCKMIVSMSGQDNVQPKPT